MPTLVLDWSGSHSNRVVCFPFLHKIIPGGGKKSNVLCEKSKGESECCDAGQRPALSLALAPLAVHLLGKVPAARSVFPDLVVFEVLGLIIRPPPWSSLDLRGQSCGQARRRLATTKGSALQLRWDYAACERSVSRSYLILRDPLDCSPPGPSVHGISQAWLLEWVARTPELHWSETLHGIFLAQGLNLHLLHWQVVSLAPSHLGSPHWLY